MLAWDTYFLSVIVKHFRADYRSSRWIPYQITCVIADIAASGGPANPPEQAGRIADDMVRAATLLGDAGAPYSAVASDIARTGIPARGTQSYLATLASLESLDAQIDAQLDAAEQLGLNGNPFNSDLAYAGADNLTAIGDWARTLATMTLARAYTRQALSRLAGEGQ